jgi:Glycosyl transferase family 2
MVWTWNVAALRSSVLVTSFRRPTLLSACLRALTGQTHAPDEILVVWQFDDYQTRNVAERLAGASSIPIRVLHCPMVGIVAAANVGLRHSTGDVVLFIDDDAIPDPDWTAKHLAHFNDNRVGAVGGSYTNLDSDGHPRPVRRPKTIGKITWYGRFIGEMFDHPEEWRTRPAISVDHLAGGNMSIRRGAITRFNEGLRPYWHAFEADACLQVAHKGYQMRFDFSNPVMHFPVRKIDSRRTGDVELTIFSPAHNVAFILALHSPFCLYLPRLLFALLIGSKQIPGLLGSVFAVQRYGGVTQEIRILGRTWAACFEGWLAGTRTRLRSRRIWASKEGAGDYHLQSSRSASE